MFHSARLKLTAWYLLIIMTISLSFSGVIYVGLTRELERGWRRMEIRKRAEDLGIPLPGFFSLRPEDLPRRLKDFSPRYFLTEDLKETKRRVLRNLLAVNGGIFILAGISGWFLAGKTLKPIEQALEEQKRFVADASHELRTPLAALKTSNEVALKDKKLTLGEAKKLIKSNLEEIESLETLTNNLLTLASLEENGQKLNFQKVDIKNIVDSTYQKILPLGLEKKIKIKIESSGGKIFGDEESLKKMILIFLDNAVKYTPEGGKIWLKTWQEKGKLILEIKDTGIGISEADLPHIFERFYRADKARAKGGFGLGLALAKRIIELHHGSVKVVSRVGKGTTFTIMLPLKPS